MPYDMARKIIVYTRNVAHAFDFVSFFCASCRAKTYPLYAIRRGITNNSRNINLARKDWIDSKTIISPRILPMM